MGYSREVYDAALAELERRRIEAVNRSAALKDRMMLKYPRIREIEAAMAGSSIQVAKAVLDGGDVESAVERIKRENLTLQAELAALLAAEGESARDFEPRYTCPSCEDTGYVNGQVCGCLKNLMREEACRRLSHSVSMELTSFDDIRLSYYPETPVEPRSGSTPRQWMANIIKFCREYADSFGPAAENLLFSGPTGTGKTHLSLSIARAATEKGYGVVYGPAQVLLRRLEKEHFGRQAGDSEEMLLECDLLILDDLGTEFGSPFTTSCLYNIINTRLLEARPTIISTNLQPPELLERYGQPIASRVVGAYRALLFMGQDIRQLQAAERFRRKV